MLSGMLSGILSGILSGMPSGILSGILGSIASLGTAASAFHRLWILSPLLRESGTVGGNLCLDNRCFYFNQTSFWREAKGGCLKEGGPTCLVVPQQKTNLCWATYSGDLAPVLQTLGATIAI
ncbi:MAG: FAD binding domain-containing protein, partial [Chloroflexi bacterium]|nr:FAD binding domain-containing protein [Chloroflexota bacterium]